MFRVKEDKEKKMTTISAGLGFTDALTILFIALKLTHVISWSWWLVFSPLIIHFGIVVIFLIILAIIWLIASAFSK